jgi:beta-galactosidase
MTAVLISTETTFAPYFRSTSVNLPEPHPISSTILSLNRCKLPINRSKWKIIYADSEEISVGNYSAEKIFDQQESTFWSTAWTVSKTPHPHHVVVNMDEIVKIKGFKYLPRTDKSTNGNVNSYRFFIKSSLFSIKK